MSMAHGSMIKEFHGQKVCGSIFGTFPRQERSGKFLDRFFRAENLGFMENNLE